MYFDRKCKITFISHGATIYSDEFRFSDNETYPPLNEAGQEEINKICDFLKLRGVKNDVIYTSASARTVQSAKIIAKMYKQEFEILEDLKPRQCGDWNGMTFSQIEEEQPEMLEKLIKNPQERLFENCECVSEFVSRVGKSIDKIVEKNIGNRIIIVTYPEVIQAEIVYALELPPERMFRFFINTGSATQISYYENWASLKYSGYVPL